MNVDGVADANSYEKMKTLVRMNEKKIMLALCDDYDDVCYAMIGWGHRWLCLLIIALHIVLVVLAIFAKLFSRFFENIINP